MNYTNLSEAAILFRPASLMRGPAKIHTVDYPWVGVTKNESPFESIAWEAPGIRQQLALNQ